MKRLGKLLIYSVIFILMVVFFTPKTQLYYALESKLDEKNIIISDETLNDSGFYFSLSGGSLHYDGLKIADLSSMQFTPLILFNRISVESFTFDQAIAQFINGDIEKAYIQYSIIDPLHVILKAEGSFGQMNRSFAFMDKHLSLDLNASSSLIKSRSPLLKKLKKTKEGLYTYESTF